MNDTDAPIAFRRLTHWYGGKRALHDLTLDVPRGSIFAMLGRNGAGKSTAIRCLLGFQRPTTGSASILGHDSSELPPAARGRIGYVSEGQRLVRWMRVRDIVRFQRATFPTFDASLADAYLKRLRLDPRAQVKTLSNGQRAQLALVLALAPRPEVVVMDDPALGLDAVVRREFLDVMIDLIQEEGRTLLFSSHILTDVERVADRVAILVDGVLRVNAPLDVVKRRIRRVHAIFENDAPPVPAIAGLIRGVRRRNEWVLTVATDGGAGETSPVEAQARGVGAREVECDGLGLEDLFIEYTSGAAEEVRS
jgi:ABC-2 type transport system ATP-binding protein